MTKEARSSTETSFGNRRVPKEERQTLVNRVFATVAERYDLMNDLMSGGLHRLWKDDLIAALNPPRGEKAYRLLDVAGGTGDVAIRYARASGPNATAVLCDISPEMMKVGRRRVEHAHLSQRITFAQGNAEELPFPDRSFDAYTIAFGLRNVTDIDKALGEAHRVLKPGGRYLCLEFSKVTSTAVGKVYDAYSERALPLLGRIIAQDAESYRYLHESIRRFPSQRDLARRMRESGFERVAWRNMTLGIVALHSGWRI
jgi:demethylmenaquinone methyltransferase/2-methoxy-6-polyprenyl-1,4-benzoquinol methylase